MKLLSSLNLPSVSKQCLASDLTMRLVYIFLCSNTGLWRLFVLILLSEHFLHLYSLSIG